MLQEVELGISTGKKVVELGVKILINKINIPTEMTVLESQL